MYVAKKQLLESELGGSESGSDDEIQLGQDPEEEDHDTIFLPKKIQTRKRRFLIFGILLMSIIVVIAVAAPVAYLKRSSSSSSHDTPQDDVITPQVDKRVYKVMKLDNELRVLLISDPEADYSAASMDVHVGSMSDPRQVQGLAHFCEHMLFLGTRKYPDEASYSGFLSERGGYDNAFTSQDHTNYYFKIERQSLFPALDRFAQFFIAPLFTESSTEREMHAVDSEHQKNLQDDDWRLWQITKDLSISTSSFHKFSTGNLETLKVPNVRNELLKFHSQHYSSNQMQLVVLGRESVANLTTYVTDLFRLIPNKNTATPSFNVPAYPSDYTGKQIWIPAVADKHRLIMRWPIQPVQQHYRANPLGYLSRLLGDKGLGSVLAFLRDKGWANTLSTQDVADTDNFSMVGLDLTLTDEGLPHIDYIVDLVFDYIELIRRQGITKELWQDRIDVDTINFRFTPKRDPADYVQNIASSMLFIQSPADFLGPPSRAVWDPDLILSVVNQLTPTNLLLFVLSRQSGILQWPELDMREHWYNVSYHVAPISNDRIKMWHDTSTINASLALPGRNVYIPKNLSLLPPPKATTAYPIIVLQEQGLEVWWKQDVVFRTPEVHLLCHFLTSLTYNTSSNFVLSRLFRQLVFNTLTKPLYSAALAGYTHSMGTTADGFTLKFYGYSDHTKMRQFIKTIIRQAKLIASASPEYIKQDNRYRVAYEEIRQLFENYPTSKQPYLTAYDFSNVALEKTRWTVAELLVALMNITEDDFRQYSSQLLDKLTVKCLAHGNLDRQNAVSYARTVVTGLGSPAAAAPFPLPQRLHLDPGANYIYRMRGLDHSDTNSAIRGIYQIGQSCFPGKRVARENCSRSLLQRSLQQRLTTLIIKNACFDQLRTKEQLGYIVDCTAHTNENVGSFQVTIQSALYNASYLTDRAEAFLTSFGVTLKTMATDTKRFEELKQSLRDELQAKDLSLLSASNKFWGEIASNQYQFSRTSQLISALDTITADSVVQFYERYIDGRSGLRSRFVVELYGLGRKFPAVTSGDITILHEEDLPLFKQNSVYYVHP